MNAYRRGCRCLDCKRARANYDTSLKGVVRQWTKLLGMPTDHPEFPHGTKRGYRYCKCEACRLANNKAKLDLNAKYRVKPGAKERQRELNAAYKATAEGQAKRRAHHATRKAKMRGAECSAKDKALMERIYGHCPDGYQVDHKIPLAKGGAHLPDNLQYLPSDVNNAKRARTDFDCSGVAIRWQDVLMEPSTTIPQGSRAKRPEVPGNPQ